MFTIINTLVAMMVHAYEHEAENFLFLELKFMILVLGAES